MIIYFTTLKQALQSHFHPISTLFLLTKVKSTFLFQTPCILKSHIKDKKVMNYAD